MGHKGHQRYWQRFLLENEQIVHTFGVSRRYVITFFWLPAAFFLVVGLVVLSNNLLLGILTLIPAGGLLMPAVFLWLFVHYAITDKRVMSREGVLHKRFVTVSFRSITDVTVNELFLERLLTRTGTIGVNTAGSNRIELHWRHIAKPVERRKDVYKHAQRINQTK